MTADGVHIAFQAHGDAGQGDLVYIPGFASNLEVEQEEPRFAQMIESLAARWRVILFDKRGCGLSDRTNTPDLEARADDLRAVLDAAESESAILVGCGEGGALAAFFAAAHPDRVTALVPMYAWAKIAAAPDYAIGMAREAYLGELEGIRNGWGSEAYAREWAKLEMPDLAEDEEFVYLFAKALRHAASPAAALEFQEIWYATDVRGILGQVQIPTLVISGAEFTGMAGDPAALSRYLADHIPGATLVTLPKGANFPPYGGAQPFIDEVARFVAAHEAEQAAFDRVLATVVFTDIVNSTPHAARLGDHAWRGILARHHQVVRAMLARYRGVEVETAGDGFFATFDGPARAVRCAQAIAEAVRPLGLEIRAGVHTGEVTQSGNHVGGLAVHIGARIGALAGPSEVVVSSTVRDLVAGSGLAFKDAGLHTLKGVPNEWRLFRAIAG